MRNRENGNITILGIVSAYRVLKVHFNFFIILNLLQRMLGLNKQYLELYNLWIML